jgi:hypothetical protein
MARPRPAIAQRKSDPISTQIMVLGRVVACRASLVVTSTSSGIVFLLMQPQVSYSRLQVRVELSVCFMTQILNAQILPDR